jgi:hypothetical protein
MDSLISIGCSAFLTFFSLPHCRIRASATLVPVASPEVAENTLTSKSESPTDKLSSCDPSGHTVGPVGWSHDELGGSPLNDPDAPLPREGVAKAWSAFACALSPLGQRSFLFTAITTPFDCTVTGTSPTIRSSPSAVLSPLVTFTSLFARAAACCRDCSSFPVELADGPACKRLRRLDVGSTFCSSMELIADAMV